MIGNYQLVQRRLTRMYMALANARSIVFGDIRAKRKLEQTAVDASVEALRGRGRDVHRPGGDAHPRGQRLRMEEYVIERLYRDAKLIELGGTTEIRSSPPVGG